MAANNITIHQAFYGEVNRAHSCIKQTLTDPDLISFLIAFTDRPAALPPGVILSPYISGSPFSKYYVFTKTFPDTSATRAGMVFTHVLILNLEDVILINRLEDVLSHFVESTESKVYEIKELQIEISDSLINSPSKQLPKYLQETISAFTFGVNPILFTGDISTFTNALQIIWNSPNTSSRKKIKFRTSFTLSDIEVVKDLTIVSIQKDFLPKWQGQKIIQGENQDKVEVNSYSEALFLGHINENPFYNFLIALNANLSEVQSYGQYEKIFANYISIEKVEDANILRQDIRTLAKISPSSDDGSMIKNKFLERLSTLIEDQKELNIKALRNIDLKPFKNGESSLSSVVSGFVAYNLIKRTHFNVLDETLELACTEEPKNWWHKAIKECYEVSLTLYTKEKIESHWQFITYSEQSCLNAFSLIPSPNQNQKYLLYGIPNTIKETILNSILTIVKKRKWYMLYAEILTKKFSIQDSLIKQLELEEKLSLVDSDGVKYLIEKLTSEELIHLALKTCNKKLIELSVEAIEKNVSLLKDIDLLNPSWLTVWTALVNKTKNVFWGLAGREKKIVSAVLDLIIKEKHVDEFIIYLVSESTFSDLSDYKNRSNVWGVIPISYREKFLFATTKGILKTLLIGKTKSETIEPEIVERITSDSFMTNFLSENRNNIEPVIIMFSCFTSLKDNFLSDYIANYRGAISEKQATKLGELVNSNKFKKSARSIYDKAKYNSSFTPAYELCKDLVSLNWWESIWSFGSQSSKPSHSFSIPVLSKEESLRASLPTVVILTAIKEEYMAVREHLKEPVDADRNDTTYEAGIFQFNGKEISKVIIRECGAKNTNAAQETERAIQYFKPDIILFVGIAGSRKPKDFSVGDVIFPEKVYSYEGGKSEKETFLSRPDNALMSYSLLEKAKKERKKDNWKILIKGNWNQDVKADLGIIASGEQVVEHYDSEIGRILHEHFNDTSAVEMEGFGFGKAANRQGRETSNILIGVVRGISDIIEQSSKKGKNKNEDRRPANAKVFASATAAAFAYWLILKTYE